MTAGSGPEASVWTDWAARAEQTARDFRVRNRWSGEDHLRASDAERAAVADELSAHFSAGRLDQGEFDERMSRAMSASTRRELPPLLADLPPVAAPPARVRRRPHRLVLGVALVVLVVALLNAAIAHARADFGWVPIAVVVLAVYAIGRRHRHRHWR